MDVILTVSSPPHIYGKDTISRHMRDVLIALSPACIFGIYVYGIYAFLTISVSVISAVLAEYVYQKIAGKTVTINDLSAVITGLLVAFNLPPGVPLWIPVIGSAFAIIAVKQLFGGLGSNFVNPALAARAFLLASFPVHMTKWTLPAAVSGVDAINGASAIVGADALSGATYLRHLAENPDFIPNSTDYMALLFGKMGGCIGEASAAALIAGGLYLIIRRVVNWRIPVFYLGSFALFTIIFGRPHSGETHLLFEVLSGGLMLGAFFMATDYATSPISPNGKIIMGIGCGFLTVLIRFFSTYPEGVSYAILIMNLFVPLIDKYMRPRIYGKVRRKA